MNQHDEFCCACGSGLVVSPATSPNSCPVCMNEIAPNQTHCKKCGSSRSVFREKEPTQVSAAASKSSKLPGIIFISIGLVVIIFALINFKITADALNTDPNPGLGLEAVMMIPLGIVGLIVLIAGLFFLSASSDKP